MVGRRMAPVTARKGIDPFAQLRLPRAVPRTLLKQQTGDPQDHIFGGMG